MIKILFRLLWGCLVIYGFFGAVEMLRSYENCNSNSIWVRTFVVFVVVIAVYNVITYILSIKGE